MCNILYYNILENNVVIRSANSNVKKLCCDPHETTYLLYNLNAEG